MRVLSAYFSAASDFWTVTVAVQSSGQPHLIAAHFSIGRHWRATAELRLRFYPLRGVALVRQQASIVTPEQTVPQPHIGGVTRSTFTATFAALRSLASAHNKDRRPRDGADRQCEQQYRLHAQSPPRTVRSASYHFRYSHSTRHADAKWDTAIGGRSYSPCKAPLTDKHALL